MPLVSSYYPPLALEPHLCHGTIWHCIHEPYYSFQWPSFGDATLWFQSEAPPLVIPLSAWLIHHTDLLHRIASFLDPGLEEDSDTLHALSLTSSYWRRAAMSRLSRVLHINTSGAMRKYKATLRLHPRHGAQVKELHVRLPKGDEQRVMFSDVMLLLKLHVNPLALQMEHMGSLCLPPMSQRFDPAVWFRNPPATLSPRDVKLRFCHFDSFNSFIRFMHNFSALTDLSVDVVSWESPPTSNDLVPLRGQARPFLLKSLSVGRYCDLDALLRWISTHVGLDHFSRLSFLSLGPTELQRLDLLLPFVRLSLEDLTLGCNFPGLPDTFNRALSTCLCMRTYPRLHTLRLRILDLQPENLQWISQILATLAPKWQDGRTTCPAASRTVATIVFDVWLFAAFQMQDAEWDKIINVLSRIALCDPMDVGDPRRRCFKIVFVHRGTMELPLAADAIKARLSGLRSTTVRIDIVGAGGAP